MRKKTFFHLEIFATQNNMFSLASHCIISYTPRGNSGMRTLSLTTTAQLKLLRFLRKQVRQLLCAVVIVPFCSGSSTLPNADPETPYGIPCLTRVEPLPRSSLEDSVFFYDEEEDDVSFAGSSFLNHLFKKDVQLPTTAHERSLTERPVESEQTIRFPAEYAGARHPAQAASAGSLVSETELARRLAQEIRVMLTPEQQQRLRARLEEQRLTLEHQQLQQQQPRQVQLKSQTPSNVSSFVGPESHVTNQEWVLQQLRLVQQQEQKQRFPGDMRTCCELSHIKI